MWKDLQKATPTNILYNHYSLTIPNNYCRLKLSGNYKVTVYDDNADREPMFTACFMVVEPQMGVSLEVTTNTDIDINNSHQQVNMIVNYNGMTINNPRDQIKTVVTQNQRWDNCKINAVPQYIMHDGLRWEHNRELIFDAGNEYHKYEILDVHHPTMGIDYLEWDGENYNVYPFSSKERLNYCLFTILYTALRRLVVTCISMECGQTTVSCPSIKWNITKKRAAMRRLSCKSRVTTAINTLCWTREASRASCRQKAVTIKPRTPIRHMSIIKDKERDTTVLWGTRTSSTNNG